LRLRVGDTDIGQRRAAINESRGFLSQERSGSEYTMKWTVLGLLLLGLVAAGAAAALAVTLQANSGIRGREAVDAEIEIMVAAKPMGALTVVNSDSVARRKVKRSEAPANALTNTVQVVGQVLVTPVVADQAFTARNFATDDSGLHLASTLTEGRRAMSIMLGKESGIEELLYPGCVVDVFASFRLPSLNGNSAEVVSATILQGIQVLAIGKNSIVAEKSGTADPAAGSKGRMVTLSLDSQQAEMLQLAVTHGEVTLAMRNPLDLDRPRMEGTRLSDLSKELADRIAALAVMEEASNPMMPPEVARAQNPMALVNGAAPVGANGSSTTAPVGPAQPEEPMAAVSREDPMWITTILRGKLKEMQKFPMPEAASPQ